MRNSLIDAGPLIALFDKDDKYHLPVKKCLKELPGHLTTTWPVITETTHLLDFNINVQIDFLKWLQRDAIQIFDLSCNNLERLIELSSKYSDLPMDLADGSLIIVSEFTGIRDIITIDSDYYVYRTMKNKSFKNILDPYLKSNTH